MAPVLRDQLGRDYPYIALHPQERAIAGQGILSRYPILEDLYWQHDEERMLGHQRAEISLPDGRTIVFYNAHPIAPMSGGVFFDPRWRDQDLESLLMLLSLETDPLVVAGDFNMTDQNRMYARLTDRLRDAYREVGYGMGWTFPNTTLFPPLLRIDYVFYSRQWTAHTAQVLAEQGGSDHLPLLVTLSLFD
jgi:endonuclease/exonuclease/phosphatase (EEP) superfamily protein YafD